MARKIEVQIVGDADSFHRAIGQATQTSSKFGSILGSTVRAGAYAAAGGIVAVGAALKVGFDEFNQHQKVAAQTGAVLKSTGGAANVTAKHIEGLANNLLNLSGVDDEVIQSGENVLLTFRNIRNEAGKGNDIFDRATKATLDLSVAMGEDLHSASIQVGKALNDPVKGLTALKRVGVQFTDAQTNLIKKLVETGKTAQAQKIILGELTKEFGGSAKAAGQTLSGQLGVLKEQFKNTAAEIVGSMLPYVIRFAKFALPIASAALQKVGDALKAVGQVVGQFAEHFLTAGNRAASAGDTIRGAWSAVSGFFSQHVMPIIKSLKGIFEDAMAAIAKTVQQHGEQLRRIAGRIGAALQAVATVAIPILRFALTKVLPVAIGIAINIIDKLTGIIASIVQACKWVANHVKGPLTSFYGVVRNIVGKIVSVWNAVLGIINSVIEKIHEAVSLAQRAASAISGFLGGGAQPGQHPNPQNPPGGGGGHFVIRNVVVLDGRVVHESVRKQDQVFRRQNGRSAFA